jgi:N utilization substance protein A
MPLEQLGLKEHVFNILVEAGIDTVGGLMMSMKMDQNRVLGLPGIGPKAMQNIEECVANLKFPEPAPVETPAEAALEPVALTEAQEETTPIAAVAEEVAAVVSEPAPKAEEAPIAEKTAPARKESKKAAEEVDDEHAKDGVSLDELFQMKPEIFQTAGEEEDESGDKKKGKKGKKKSVELQFDEERGEVVGRKKHKRGDADFGEDW